MLQLNKLNEIDGNNFTNAINNSIKNKVFIRLGLFKDIHKDLPDYEQLAYINYLVFNAEKLYVLIKTVNNIEWTPEKLYQTAFYMVNFNNKYWLISNSNDGFIIKSHMTFKKYIESMFNLANKANNAVLDYTYWCNSYELLSGYQYLEQNNIDCYLIKQITFPNSALKINHYIIKMNNIFYYFCISNKGAYKPIVYK